MSEPDLSRTFTQHSECVAYLKEHLGLDREPANDPLLLAFADLCEQNSSKTPGYELDLGRWVVKFEDIGVFSAVRNAFISFGTVGYVAHDIGSGGVAATLFAATELLTNIYRSFGTLTPRQARIIFIMKKEGKPVTSQTIASWPTAEGDLGWNQSAVDAELTAMQQVLIGKGSMKIVDKIADGRWFLNGI